MHTFDNVTEDGRLLYEYVRGSYLYNLQEEGISDVDTGGIYICRQQDAYGFISYPITITDEKNDKVWREIGDFYHLLSKSNYMALEALFVPKRRMITLPHKILYPLFENKEKFLTKDFVQSSIARASAELKLSKAKCDASKAPMVGCPSSINYMYALQFFKGKKLLQFLSYYDLKPAFCSLAAISTAEDCYALYYDWGAEFKACHMSYDDIRQAYKSIFGISLGIFRHNRYAHHILQIIRLIVFIYRIRSVKEFTKWLDANYNVQGYQGIKFDAKPIMKQYHVNSSTMPICITAYDRKAYENDLAYYEKQQNSLSSEKGNIHYHPKSILYAVRIIDMSQEILDGEGLNLVRTKDRQLLLNIKHGLLSDENVLELLETKISAVKKALETSSLPQSVDKDMINDLLIAARKEFYQK